MLGMAPSHQRPLTPRSGIRVHSLIHFIPHYHLHPPPPLRLHSPPLPHASCRLNSRSSGRRRRTTHRRSLQRPQKDPRPTDRPTKRLSAAPADLSPLLLPSSSVKRIMHATRRPGRTSWQAPRRRSALKREERGGFVIKCHFFFSLSLPLLLGLIPLSPLSLFSEGKANGGGRGRAPALAKKVVADEERRERRERERRERRESACPARHYAQALSAASPLLDLFVNLRWRPRRDGTVVMVRRSSRSQRSSSGTRCSASQRLRVCGVAHRHPW